MTDYRCTCGHTQAQHFHERGECMASTPSRSGWACNCHKFTADLKGLDFTSPGAPDIFHEPTITLYIPSDPQESGA